MFGAAVLVGGWLKTESFRFSTSQSAGNRHQAVTSCHRLVHPTGSEEGPGASHPRRRRPARGGAYAFSGGNGARAGGGRSLSRIAVRVRMRGENGYRSPSMMRSSSPSSAAVSSSDSFQVHAPQVGALTVCAESAAGAGERIRHRPLGARFADTVRIILLVFPRPII
jgi:hypothetical protein